jgi:hypothetical protein
MDENKHEHDRFLYSKDGKLHFGCINPFCGHGDPALPNHWEIPMETKSISIISAKHDKEHRLLSFEIRFKVDVGRFKKDDVIQLPCTDNLECCKITFGQLFT